MTSFLEYTSSLNPPLASSKSFRMERKILSFLDLKKAKYLMIWRATEGGSHGGRHRGGSRYLVSVVIREIVERIHRQCGQKLRHTSLYRHTAVPSKERKKERKNALGELLPRCHGRRLCDGKYNPHPFETKRKGSGRVFPSLSSF